MEKVKKLSMCRICLVENVRMYVVTNKSLQEMYEKLTDVPFVTEDSRPMLACFFCCTKLKQCCQLQRKCLEAEELLAQMLNEDYEKKLLTKQEHLEFAGGFIISPVENISIVEEHQAECDAIKQELADVCEEQCDVELKVEHISEELDPGHVDISHPEDTPALNSTSESEDEELVTMIKIEKDEQELFEQEHRGSETEKLKLEHPDVSYGTVEDTRAQNSESDSEDVPLMEMKTVPEEVQEASKKTRRASVARSSAVAKKPKLSRKGELEDTIPGEQPMNELSNSTVTRTTKSYTSEADAKFQEFIATLLSQSSLVRSSHSKQLDDQIHSDEKPYKCEVCQRSFSCQSALKTHFRKHSGETPFKCEVCQLSFRYKKNLKIHFRKHTGEKPYKCQICQRSFADPTLLKRHSRVHTGEKPYKCDVCQRCFRVGSSLRYHIRTHTGVKPYKCEICPRNFARLDDLKRHNNRIHIDNSVKVV